jgi:hypothetical protein
MRNLLAISTIVLLSFTAACGGSPVTQADLAGNGGDAGNSPISTEPPATQPESGSPSGDSGSTVGDSGSAVDTGTASKEDSGSTVEGDSGNPSVDGGTTDQDAAPNGDASPEASPTIDANTFDAMGCCSTLCGGVEEICYHSCNGDANCQQSCYTAYNQCSVARCESACPVLP